ncbi:MAG: SRPBCC family protein [Candidatus Dormibacteraeota bacterium]|uniref:SRPBCC family protein n=1 Tax=Candidatus Amunia macphersoniae TaxID=3127014 RepID=A0A934NGR5_9BACT|nr:SRPBCC family protein [Candidatus Dormibacteraeota bacterium]
MRVHVLERTQVIPRPVDQVFPFFATASNLERITPPFLRFEMLTPEPDEMRVGTRLEYLLHVHGVPIRWISRIDAWNPGHSFVDRQLRGPYALWEHTHEVEPHPHGTLSRDRVRYALPLGVLGEVANRLLVQRDLRRIFDYRREAIVRLLG